MLRETIRTSEERQKKVDLVIKTAHDLIGAPYKYGAYLEESASNQTGFDCSSFIQYIFKPININLPRSTIIQAATPGEEIVYPDIVMPGDIIFFEGTRGHFRHDLFPNRKIYIGHVALSIGSSSVIHATNNPTASGVVKQLIITLPNPPYNIVLVKRFI